MNAEAITNKVLDRIRPWLGEDADVERIHYAIERSHASVISGLTPPAQLSYAGRPPFISGNPPRGSDDNPDSPAVVDYPSLRNRIADLESQVRALERQVKAALAVRGAYLAFERECGVR